MKIKGGIILVSIICLQLFTQACTPKEQAESNDKPNIVWIFSDDHSYQTIGAYGGRQSV